MEHGHGKCHEPIPFHLKTQTIIDVSVDHSASRQMTNGYRRCTNFSNLKKQGIFSDNMVLSLSWHTLQVPHKEKESGVENKQVSGH